MFVCPTLKSLGLNVSFKLKCLLIAMLPFNAIVKKGFHEGESIFGALRALTQVNPMKTNCHRCKIGHTKPFAVVSKDLARAYLPHLTQDVRDTTVSPFR